MIDIDNLYIVNSCHPNCVPLKNIMRLPKEDAFAIAYQMAVSNKETTAFYRFADFDNYYPLRLKTNKVLYDTFVSLGGHPNCSYFVVLEEFKAKLYKIHSHDPGR